VAAIGWILSFPFGVSSPNGCISLMTFVAVDDTSIGIPFVLLLLLLLPAVSIMEVVALVVVDDDDDVDVVSLVCCVSLDDI
jgi:hypothetical protein